MHRSVPRIASLILGLALSAGVLVAAPRPAGLTTVPMSGVVSDGSGAGWPLYARIEATSASTDPIVAFTDPVTGAYTMSLFDGVDYQVAVTALAPGYSEGGGPVSAAGSPISKNWTVSVNAAACNAPGYQAAGFDASLSESFDGGVLPPGWTIQTTSGVAWQIASGADPCGQFPGNETGGSGAYAILNSDCFSNGFDTDDSSLITPPVDLSGLPNAALRWKNDFHFLETQIDVADVDVSIDGGTTWSNVWEQTYPDSPGPNTQSVDISFAAGHAGVQARFHNTVFWGWWWQVDDVLMGQALCNPQPGGLVVGKVVDANTGLGLDGATVENLTDGGSVVTSPTGDPAQGDGYYALFAAAGSPQLRASLPPYLAQTQGTTVTANGVVRLDFSLGGALLDPTPRPVSVNVVPGGSTDQELSLANLGGASAAFKLLELDSAHVVSPGAPVVPVSGRFASKADVQAALLRVPRDQWNARDSRGRTPLAPAVEPRLAGAGNVLVSFPSNLASGWGLTYDTDANALWVSNPDDPVDGQNGDGFEHQYLPDGTDTGSTIDIHSTGGSWQADGTYNARTGTMWAVNVGGDNCLFEMDPVTKLVTGKTICGPWTTSQRGLAYDYATDTYYVGGANESVIYHIDPHGVLLDSVSVPLPIEGLAYNPATGHLFVGGQTLPFDVHVLDTRNGYALVGGIQVTAGGVPVLAGNGVSLEADCSNRLWIYHPFDQIAYAFESGETGWCSNDVSWLTETPSEGTVAANDALPINLHFDASGLQPGLHLSQLLFRQDTPYAVAPLPVSLTVLFNDVPVDAFAANFIYAAAGAGVMPGGLPTCAVGGFCPNGVVTRADMAGYIYRAVHGALAAPPVYRYPYADVALNDYNAFYIQGITDDRITAGCGNGDYCPSSPNTRAQMAVFVWKAQHGADAPPACTGLFADVPCPGGFAADYIEGIAGEGVTAGCGSGNFCPNANITNAQMAVFLVKAFEIPHL